MILTSPPGARSALRSRAWESREIVEGVTRPVALAAAYRTPLAVVEAVELVEALTVALGITTPALKWRRTADRLRNSGSYYPDPPRINLPPDTGPAGSMLGLTAGLVLHELAHHHAGPAEVALRSRGRGGDGQHGPLFRAALDELVVLWAGMENQ